MIKLAIRLINILLFRNLKYHWNECYPLRQEIPLTDRLISITWQESSIDLRPVNVWWKHPGYIYLQEIQSSTLVMETQGRLASVFAILFFNESYVEDVPDSNSKQKRVKYEGWGILPTGVRSWSPRLPPSILNQTFQEILKDFWYNI